MRIPVERWDSSTLCDYCRHRGLNISNKSSSDIIEIVHRAIQYKVAVKPLQNNEDYPPDYTSIDNIVCEGPVSLKPFDDYVLSLIKDKIFYIDSKFISETYGNSPKKRNFASK